MSVIALFLVTLIFNFNLYHASTTVYQSGNVVTLDYNDLIDGKDLTREIETAFGKSGLGLLTVKNVPNFQESNCDPKHIGNLIANVIAKEILCQRSRNPLRHDPTKK